MLREVVVQVSAVHKVQYETEFVGRMERIRHAHDERAVDLQQIR